MAASIGQANMDEFVMSRVSVEDGISPETIWDMRARGTHFIRELGRHLRLYVEWNVLYER